MGEGVSRLDRKEGEKKGTGAHVSLVRRFHQAVQTGGVQKANRRGRAVPGISVGGKVEHPKDRRIKRIPESVIAVRSFKPLRPYGESEAEAYYSVPRSMLSSFSSCAHCSSTLNHSSW